MKRWLLLLTPLLLLACRERSDRVRVVLWHQMVPAERAILAELIARFEDEHPDVEVRALYKETEELRSGFQAAALAGAGPALVYGPSDAIGPFQTMGIVQDMARWLPADEQAAFVDGTLTRLPSRDPQAGGTLELLQVGDRVGNHLALVCNRTLLPEPPATDEELVRLAQAATVDEDGDGRPERYGIVWNFTEPFFVIPFLTGHGSWIFDRGDPSQTTPDLDNPPAVAVYRFVLDLRYKGKVMPSNLDYEGADALFKEGRAAMIINGDWSWGDYLARPELAAYVWPLPTVVSTGTPMGPMVATKGYSLNANADPATADAAMALVRHLTSAASQRRFMAELKTLPSRRTTRRCSAAARRPSRPPPACSATRSRRSAC